MGEVWDTLGDWSGKAWKNTGGGGLTGDNKIKNYVLDPYFRKSYSVIDQLSPFIKVGVKIPTPKKVINEQEQKFFDIPYNFIKSLKVENKYGESATDVLTLTLEDPQGTISAILFAHLHLLSSSRGLPAGGMATIAIQYGYADVNPFKVALKTITPRPYLQSDYKEYLILGADISYENMKQKLTITARSRYSSGINPEVALQSTPFAKIGVTPLVDLVRNRLMMIDDSLFTKTYGKSRTQLSISDEYYGFPSSDRKDMPDSKSFFTYAFNKEENKLFLSKTRLIETKSTTDPNTIKKTKLAIEALDTQRTSTYSTISLHPYLCLIYLIYQYLEVLKESNKGLKIFFLTGYEESKDVTVNGKRVGIDGWEEAIGTAPNFSNEEKIKEWLAKLTTLGSTISTKAKINWIKPMEFKITEKDTWSTIISKVAQKVMVNYVAKEKDKKGTEKDVIKQHPLQFTTLFYPKIQGAHNNHNSKKANLKKVLQKRRDATNYRGIIDSLDKPNDETLIILIEPSGSVFKEASDSPLQKYTIFPKTKATRKTTDVIFDSGSKNLIDENFPDVISFNPKIKFKELIDSLIGQQSTRHDFFTNEDQLNGENIRIKDIAPSTPKDSPIIKDAAYYQKLNKAVSDLITDLNKFADGTRNGDMEIKSDGKYIFFPSNSNVGIWTTKMSEKGFDSILKPPKTLLSQNTQIHKNFVDAILHDYKEFVRSQLGAPLSRSVAKAFNTSEAVFQGEPNSPIYNKMILEQEKFYKLLKNQNANFDAELKILGEPAFSYTWSGGPPTIFLEVNAPDGTPNFLCTGLYSITGITQDIEGGKFTTTLQLKWDHSKTINDYLEGN